jgi:cation-transporting ATPase 13A1
MTAMVIAVCFMFISRSKPLDKLSPQHPNRHFFTPYIVVSVLAQFATHLAVLVYAHRIARSLEPLCVPPLVWLATLRNADEKGAQDRCGRS